MAAEAQVTQERIMEQIGRLGGEIATLEKAITVAWEKLGITVGRSPGSEAPTEITLTTVSLLRERINQHIATIHHLQDQMGRITTELSNL